MTATSAYYECLSSIKAAIESLATGITNASIVIQPVSHYKGDMPKPFISISPYGPERAPEGTNLRESVIYPVLVAVIVDRDAVGGLDAALTVRQKIRRRFHHASLSGITLGSLVQTTVAPMNAVEPGVFLRDGLIASGMIIECEVRELRT